MFLTDFSDKLELLKSICLCIIIYVFIMTILFFLLLYHVVDIHTIVDQLQKCTMIL